MDSGLWRRQDLPRPIPVAPVDTRMPPPADGLALQKNSIFALRLKVRPATYASSRDCVRERVAATPTVHTRLATLDTEGLIPIYTLMPGRGGQVSDV